MSALIVEVCKIDKVEPHPNADKLKIATVKGWQACIGLDDFEEGDKCIFIPPDSILPVTMTSGRLQHIAKYLSPLKKNSDGTENLGLRVRATRLRGFPSYGVIEPIRDGDPDWEVGTDLVDHFGITKYTPPVKIQDGEAESEDPLFHKYTSIENIGNYPDVIKDGTEVVITEKLHGSNCRLGMIHMEHEEGNRFDWVRCAGSMDIRRKEYTASGAKSKYWTYFTPELASMMIEIIDHQIDIGEPAKSVIVFGELYGEGIQDMHYGKTGYQLAVFDIAVDGKYIDFDKKTALCATYNIPVVPILYRGPFSREKVLELTDGNTTLCDASEIKGSFKGREGVVITPVVEEYSQRLFNRLILKSISVDYLSRKNQEDNE